MKKTKRELEQAVVRAAMRWMKDCVPVFDEEHRLIRAVNHYLDDIRATKRRKKGAEQ